MGGNWKDLGYLLLGHICFVGQVSKKHVATNAAAVAHGKNGHQSKTGSFMVVVHMAEPCLGGKV